jgi:hypothetical protein
MSEDITKRLADISEMMMEGQPFNDGDFTDIDEAINEIERLRNERDEARRECCTWQGLESGKRKQDVAVARGWDYLRWPDPGALDRLAKLDEELGF